MHQTLHIQTALRDGMSLEELQKKYAIKTRRHAVYPNLILFKYNLLESPLLEPIVQECRGLILDEDREWKVVSFPFQKFFNVGEPGAANINWKAGNVQVQEKVDGSLMCLYWYDGKWQIQTSGTPDGLTNVMTYDTLFAELFDRVMKERGYDYPPEELKDYTFMFELTTPENRVIVRYTDRDIHWTGVRNNISMYEGDPRQWYDWWLVHEVTGVWKHPPFPRIFTEFNSLEEIKEATDQLNPLVQEGFVIVDHFGLGLDYKRVKLKSTSYVDLAHMKDGLGVYRLLDIVVTNESPEFLAYFPEYYPIVEKIQNAYGNLTIDATNVYDHYKNLESQKEFALNVKDHPLSGAMFMMRAGKVHSVREFVKDHMSRKKLADILGLRETMLEPEEQ